MEGRGKNGRRRRILRNGGGPGSGSLQRVAMLAFLGLFFMKNGHNYQIVPRGTNRHHFEGWTTLS
jgi:hypothetical protein